MRRFWTDDRKAFALLAALILLPQFATFGPKRHLGAARVCTGDEPHYLVLLHSVVDDFDVALANNYVQVHQGGPQAGASFAGKALDHHTVISVGAEWVPWNDLYVPAGKRAGEGDAVHVLREGVTPPPPDAVEHSNHPAGIALLAPLLLPFGGTRWLEPAALLLSALATLVGAWAFRKIARAGGGSPAATNVAMVIAFVATPVWHYSRTFYNEPFLLAAALGAVALHLSGRSVWASAVVAIAMPMKPPFALLALPSLVDDLRARRWRQVVVSGAILFAAALSILAMHAVWYGSPWRSPQPFQVGDPLAGIVGFLVSWERGVLVLAPVFALAFLGWPAFLRRAPRVAAVALASFLLYFLLMATWHGWHGAWCYGPRLIVPVLPLLALGMVPVLERAGRWWWRAAIGALLVVSLGINGMAALQPCRVQSHTPLDYLRMSLTR